LLGVKLVLAESFERIHRSNLVGMGVLPLQFMDGMDRTTLTLDGSEWFDLTGISHGLTPSMTATLTIHRINGDTEDISVLVRVDTGDEAMTVAEGGILQRIYRNLPEPGATAA
jgi:aconitate hydratase